MWPEVVMENHTRSSAVHGKSHTSSNTVNLKFLLIDSKTIYLVNLINMIDGYLLVRIYEPNAGNLKFLLIDTKT